MRRAVALAGGLGLLAAAAGCQFFTGAGSPGPARRKAAFDWTEISLRETAGVERRGEPVRVGLPFPPGALPGPGNLRVVGSDGRELPSQRRAQALWPDGSVRWLELLFEPSVAANAVGRYRAEFGSRIKAGKVGAPLAAENQKGVIRIDTGRLLLEWSEAAGSANSSSRSAGLSLWFDADGDGKYSSRERVLAPPGLESFVELEPTAGGAKSDARGAPAARQPLGAPRAGRYSSLGPRTASLELEEAGPLRAVVACRLGHEDAAGNRVCPATVRLYAWRGSARLRLVHTLVLSENPAAVRLAEAGLTLALEGLDGPPRTLRQSVAAPKRYPDFAGFEPKAALLEGPKVLAEEPSRGFLSGRLGRPTVALAVPRPAENAPWELRLEPESARAVAAFWPRWGAELTDPRSPEERGAPGWAEFTRTESFERFCASERPASAAGAARTHELWLAFEPPGAAAGGEANLAAAVNAPLVAWPGAERLEWSSAFGRFACHNGSGEPAAALARGQERLLDWIRRHQRVRFGWLGLWDYGDCQTIYRQYAGLDVGERWWNWHGQWGWMQGRGELPRAFLLPWLKSGNPADWEDFRAAVEHNLDVDTVHGAIAGRAGLTHGPGLTHWTGAPSLAATWPACWLDYYYLSGEPRALEMLASLSASLQGRSMADFAEPGRAFSAEQAGLLRARLAAHEAFGEAQAAGARAALEHLRGLTARELGGAELWPQAAAPALIRYHRVFGDPLAARLIERGTRAYLATRASSPRSSALDRNVFEACAYAWRLTGEESFLERGRFLAERSAAARAGGEPPAAAGPAPAAEAGASLANDSRDLLELIGLPYLQAALEEAAAGRRTEPGTP